MSIPRVDGLRIENWRNLSIQERLGELQNLENALAIQDNRTPCEVKFIPTEAYEKPEDHQSLRGLHEGKDIFINENLVKDNKPYMATETLFHEDRHDYQEHMAKQPESAKDSVELQDFRKNITPEGYLDPKKEGYPLYRWQPIEKDANEVARQCTEELYSKEFGDKTQYPEHRQQMEHELSDDIFRGQVYQGNNYVEQARNKMIERYNESQSKSQGDSLDNNKFNQDEPQGSSPNGKQHIPANEKTEEKIIGSDEEITNKGKGSPEESTSGKVADFGKDKRQEVVEKPVNQLVEMPSENLTSSAPPSNESFAKSTGEIAGEAAGGPAGAAAGKASGEAANETQEAVDDSIGQSTKSPPKAIEEASEEAPSTDASRSDEEQYYGYGL